MRSARHELVSTSEPGYYHCVSRCVRRAFLCGEDGYSGRSFSHRKQWIEDRLLELANAFAIGVYAYAVMSNHVHVVVHVDPLVAARWSPDEVATRWSGLFPVRYAVGIDEAATSLKATMIASDPERVAVLRERLSSLSWFMRCLNEPIARLASRWCHPPTGKIRPHDTGDSQASASSTDYSAPMRSARHELVSTSEPGYYHCVSRCVRRAFLCGNDRYSGRSFDHRKQWIEDRLLELADLFAVGVYAYAVMSNHVHIVVNVDPLVSASWSPDEVATRWSLLFPARYAGGIDEAATLLKAKMIASDPERVAVSRERLSSLSWFMRCLNEPIARLANHEDACTGRFWEGRYKCQALLDETALLACMTYVDLNPIRAGFATDLNSSSHTSIHRRLRTTSMERDALQPVSGSVGSELSPSSNEYVLMVEWTGSRLCPGKRGRLINDVPAWMRRRGVDPEAWSVQVASIETRYWRAIGSIEALIDKARAMGRRWLKGSGRRKIVLRPL